MRNRRESFTHIAFRQLRDFKSYIILDNNKFNKTDYKAIAQGYINGLWLYNFITSNTRNLLTAWLYSIEEEL